MNPGVALRLETLRRYLPTKRHVKWFFIVFFICMFLGSALSVATAQAAEEPACMEAGDCEETPVMEPGDLIPIKDASEGGPKTLFESYDFSVWFIDSELNGTWIDDGLDNILQAVVMMLWWLLLVIVYATIGIAWWLFGSTDVPGLGDAVNDLMTSANSAMLTWLFPTSLALGAIVVYIKERQARGSGFEQVAWLFVAGALSVGLATDSGVFTNGVDQIRTVGSDMILTVSAGAIDSNNEFPLPYGDDVDYDVNTPEDKMLRQSADSIWRTLVVTPWCLVDFGSIEGCQKYGPLMLEAGNDTEAREDVIFDTIYKAEGMNGGGGKESPTGQWVKGENNGQRLGMIAMSLVLALVYCVLLLVLGFAALSAIMLTYLLLFAGVFFAALWCIPGKPRQWGVAWAETLLGAIMLTFVALLAFGGVLALLTALWAASAAQGWLVSAFLALVLLLTGFGFRNKLAEIVNARSTGAGRAALVGAFMMRGAGRAAARMPGRMKGGALKMGRAARGTGRAAAATGRGMAAGGRFARRASQRAQTKWAGVQARAYSPRPPRGGSPDRGQAAAARPTSGGSRGRTATAEPRTRKTTGQSGNRPTSGGLRHRPVKQTRTHTASTTKRGRGNRTAAGRGKSVNSTPPSVPPKGRGTARRRRNGGGRR